MEPTHHHRYRLEILFRLRYPAKKAGQANRPAIIYLRISLDGQRGPELSMFKKVLRKDWDFQQQLVKASHPDQQEINDYLEIIKARIRRIALLLAHENKPFTANDIYLAFKKRLPFTHRLRFDDCFTIFFKDKLEECKIGEIGQPTLSAYQRYNRNFQRFLHDKHAGRQVFPQEINFSWMTAYKNYLKGELHFTNDYPSKNLEFVKQVLRHCERHEIITVNPSKAYKVCAVDHYDTTHLETADLIKLTQLDFSQLDLHPQTAKSLAIERDCFLITCFTGQHHQDLQQKHLKAYIGIDGRIWVRDSRVKTGVQYNLPLHPIAMTILKQYATATGSELEAIQSGILNLPVRSNPKRNGQLKDIAKLAGIEVWLTTKIGRKTFADFLLNEKGVRKETVASLLGHRTTKYVEKYANIREQSIAREYQF